MDKRSQRRTLNVLLMLVLFVVVNTFLNLLDIYRGWFAIGTYAIEMLCFAIALRFQHRLPAALLTGLLLIPFLVATMVALSRSSS